MAEGIHTSIPLHQRILADPDFLGGSFDTKVLGRFRVWALDVNLSQHAVYGAKAAGGTCPLLCATKRSKTCALDNCFLT